MSLLGTDGGTSTKEEYCRETENIYLVLMPLKLEFVTELRLERPLSLAELVSIGGVCDGESRSRSNLPAESGLYVSRPELLRLPLVLFLAALFRKERKDFNICEDKNGRNEHG